MSKSNSEVSKSNSNILVRNNFFLENDVTAEGAVPHNVLYYQRLPITHYTKNGFYANNYFEPLPIVSSAFKEHLRSRVLNERFIPSGIMIDCVPNQTIVNGVPDIDCYCHSEYSQSGVNSKIVDPPALNFDF